MYTDYFLKFTDAAQAEPVLFEGTGDERKAKYAAVDVIGTVYQPTGNMVMFEDFEAPEMAPVPGWHANVRHTASAPELAAYQVYPQTPVRNWA